MLWGGDCLVDRYFFSINVRVVLVSVYYVEEELYFGMLGFRLMGVIVVFMKEMCKYIWIKIIIIRKVGI